MWMRHIANKNPFETQRWRKREVVPLWPESIMTDLKSTVTPTKPGLNFDDQIRQLQSAAQTAYESNRFLTWVTPHPHGGAFMEFKKEPRRAEWRAARDHDRALKIGFSMQPFIFQHSGSRKLICTTPTKEVFQHSENRSPQRRSKENRFINLLFKLLFLILFTCQSSPPDLSRFTSPHSFHI